jgi:transmembrane sensor
LASADRFESTDERAAHWAVLEAYGEMTPQEERDLQAWLDADNRHYGAYMRAKAGLYAMEDALAGEGPAHGADNDNDRLSPDLGHAVSRWGKRFAAAGAAIAASIAAFAFLQAPIPQTAGPVPRVAASIMHLEDGSVATLQPGARIAFARADGMRKVTLLRGQASFQVAKDKAHPFVVRSGAVYAQATGTVYSVTRVGDTGGAVHVTEGSVLVWARDERDQAVLLYAGGRLTLDPGPQPRASRVAVARPLPPPDLAQFSFDDVSIRSAVARFNRVNSTKIVLASAAIGETRIVGLFSANDPEQFAQAAAALSGGVVEHKGDAIVIKVK